ncbi:unnamed protein product [Parajaminaea phylloscopi]
MAAKRLISTPFTQLIPALRTPIVCGPMANAAGGELAAQVSRAGGLGFIGAGYYTPERLKDELQKTYGILGKPERGQGSRLEIGIGFLAWKLTSFNGGSLPPSLGSTDMDAGSQALKLIDEALRSKPRAVWLSFGSGEELVGWSKIVREREAAINGAGRAKWGTDLKLFIGVGNSEEAKTAVEDCGADVLVVQGIEGGGHGLGSSPPLTSVLPLVKSMLSSWSPSSPSEKHPVLLGAGGLHSGASLAAVLALGGAGAVFGTRFLLTPEASYSREQKQMLIDAKEGQTKRTMAFDEARGTLGWPKGVDGRGIVNDTVQDYESGEGDAASRRQRYVEAEKAGDTRRIVTWAGSGVGNMSTIKPAFDVVHEIDTEAVTEIENLSSLLNVDGQR